MHKDYKYVQCGIKMKGMKTYYDNRCKEENTTLWFPNIKNGDGVQKLVASILDDSALDEWELHTLEDMRRNDTHQLLMKSCSWDNITSMRWLLWQRDYAEHLIYAPQSWSNSDTPPKRLYADMHPADWWWETQVRRDTPGR